MRFEKDKEPANLYELIDQIESKTLSNILSPEVLADIIFLKDIK